MREWSLQLHLLDEEGNERPADLFTKVVYNLHPTFENPVQSTFSAPGFSRRGFRRKEEGKEDSLTGSKSYALVPSFHETTFFVHQ